MKKTLYYFLFISISFINFYCVSDASQQQNNGGNSAQNQTAQYDALAKEYCECSTEIIALNKKMQQLNNEGKFEEMGDLLNEIDEKSPKQAACQEQLENKYRTKIDTSKAVLASIKRVCPDLGGFLENAKKDN
jgi:hypothetical protein